MNIFLLILLISFQLIMTYEIQHRHLVYWDTSVTPQLKNNDYVIDVKIGQFMDILCPHRLLVNSQNHKNHMVNFDLYNVTKKQFDDCDEGGRENFIFACDRPERENKLTIKFQVISPSPFGFRFQYCQDYYFLAKVRSNKNYSCDQYASRLRISVGCREKPIPFTIASRRASSPQNNPAPTPINSYDRFIEKMMEHYVLKTKSKNGTDKDVVLVPKLRKIHPDQNKATSEKLIESSSNKEDRNNANIIHVQKFGQIFVCILCTISLILL